MSIHLLVKPDDNHRYVPFLPDVDPEGKRFITSRRDPVEPLPVGSYIACVFRVTGYDPDCDGSLMARLEQVDKDGEPSGWTPDCLGLYPDFDVVVDGPGDLHALIDDGA